MRTIEDPAAVKDWTPEDHMRLSPDHRKHLGILATHLERLPWDYNHFTMRTFFADRTESFLNGKRNRNYVNLDQYLTKPELIEQNCGTVACALGHGPAAGISPFLLDDGEDMIACLDDFDWLKYATLFCEDPIDFYWLFSGGWGSVDDTHRGAAARIRYLLAHGHPPKGFFHDRHYEDLPSGTPITETYAQYRVS